MTVCPVVDAAGTPAVALVVRKDADVTYEATLDGHPATAIFLREDGAGNAPWELGHLLAENWEQAKKMAQK